jgi:hypothetical protein
MRKRLGHCGPEEKEEKDSLGGIGKYVRNACVKLTNALCT